MTTLNKIKKQQESTLATSNNTLLLSTAQTAITPSSNSCLLICYQEMMKVLIKASIRRFLITKLYKLPLLRSSRRQHIEWQTQELASLTLSPAIKFPTTLFSQKACFSRHQWKKWKPLRIKMSNSKKFQLKKWKKKLSAKSQPRIRPAMNSQMVDGNVQSARTITLREETIATDAESQRP